MFLAIDVSLALCMLSLAWALAMRFEQIDLPWLGLGLPRPVLSIPGLIEQHRDPISAALRQIGRVWPRGDNWSADSMSTPVYPGSRMTIEEFRGLRVLAGLLGVAAAVVIATQLKRVEPIVTFGACAAGFLAPQLWVRGRIKKRESAILKLLPEVIDLLALCVGAGADFLSGLNKIISVEQYQGQPLVDELSIAIQEMKFGKRKAEALKAMARRVNLNEVSSFVRAIVLADRMGTPIADVLAVHAEDVRMDRYNRAEREAMKAPIKILFPLIFCIMPCVAIIVGAPVFIQFSNANPFGALQQGIDQTSQSTQVMQP
jgi:tight adherence protein C